MKTKTKIKNVFLRVCLVIIGVVLILLFIPFGNESYAFDETHTIEVPKLSIAPSKVNDYTIIFYNVRTVFALTKDVEQMLGNLEERNCNDTVYYYDRKQDYTITNYNLVDAFVLNRIEFNYTLGDACVNKTE